MKFELTNNDRKYIGVNLVKPNWQRVQLTEQILLFFEKNTIVKCITHSDNSYQEVDMHEETAENRTILLPKTKRGKPKKLNFSSFKSRNGIGTYFTFTVGYDVSIASFTTKKTFYSTNFEDIEIRDFVELRKWLDNFISSSPEGHLDKIESFGKEKRQNINIKEGDFFAFKVDRENYGFGRVLLHIGKLRKEKSFEKENNYGLRSLMGQPLTIKIYHKISKTKNIAITELKKLKCFPSEYIMDNRLFYGDYEIIGNLPLENSELEFPISFSESYYFKERDLFYLQWGLIYAEKNSNQLPSNLKDNYFTYESAGLVPYLNKNILINCIKNNSNDYYWQSDAFYSIRDDLRNPKNQKYKDKILKEFGLNPKGNYYENLMHKST